MRANIAGVPHRIVFQHKMLFADIPAPGGVRKVPVAFEADLTPWPRFHRIPKARAVTICAILTPVIPDGIAVTEPNWQVVASAPAVCSWSEKTFDKEFARQLALARVIETLPRAIGAPLVGAYMQSGRRTVCNLTAASRGRYASLQEALPSKASLASDDTPPTYLS
jgi:hypothetical protein